jgi:hypothetical protein
MGFQILRAEDGNFKVSFTHRNLNMGSDTYVIFSPNQELPRLPASSNVDPGIIFRQAREDFMTSLSATQHEQLSRFSSSEELLDELGSFEFMLQNTRRGRKLLGGVKDLTDALEPYFKVIEIFCNSHPEVSSLVWGTIRLLLQVSI